MSANQEKLERLHAQLRYEVGPGIRAALEDPTVTGIKVGEDGKLWLKKHVVRWQDTGEIVAADQRLRALNTMASLLGKTINERSPQLSGELPLTGDRVEGSVFPSSTEASFVIRLHAGKIFTLVDYVRDGILEEWQADVLTAHVRGKSNIVWSGATDSGKSTAANACLHLLTDSPEHVVIIEDTIELQCAAPNLSRYQTGDPHPTMLEQIKACMRRDPDRIVIGETRGREGLELLKSWDTGSRGGITTVHATEARGVFRRFKQFCLEAGVPPQWELMQSAIDLICHIEMTPNGRRVTEMLEVRKEDTQGDMPVHFMRLGPPIAVEKPITHGGETNGAYAIGDRDCNGVEWDVGRKSGSGRDGDNLGIIRSDQRHNRHISVG